MRNKYFSRYFSREQAEQALKSIQQIIPFEVQTSISDVCDNDDVYQYSFIAFSLNDGSRCVCTVSNFSSLTDLSKFIDLMTGFQYPPQGQEQDFSYDDQWNKDRQDPYKRWQMEQGEYPNDPLSRDNPGNTVEVLSSDSYMDLSVSKEKTARVFEAGDYDELPF